MTMKQVLIIVFLIGLSKALDDDSILLPVADPKLSHLTPEGIVILDGTASIGDDVTFTWTMLEGDNLEYTSNEYITEYMPTTSGNYTWLLTVCDAIMIDVCDSKAWTVLINAGCVVKAIPELTPNIFIPGEVVEMQLDGSKSTGPIVTYEWTMLTGDFIGMTINNISFSYFATVGSLFEWKLTVYGKAGEAECEDSDTVEYDFPDRGCVMEAIPELTTNITVEGNVLEMQFDGSKSKGPIVKYEWTMVKGDHLGMTVNDISFSYFTTIGGVYEWQLTVYGKSGEAECEDSDTVEYDFSDTDHPNGPPGVTADAKVKRKRNGNIKLDGSGSTGDINRYIWIMIQGDKVGHIIEGKKVIYKNPKSGISYVWELIVIGIEDADHDHDAILIQAETAGCDVMAIAKVTGGIAPLFVDRTWVMNLDASDSKGPIIKYTWQLRVPLLTIPYPPPLDGKIQTDRTTTPGIYVWVLTVFGKNGEETCEDFDIEESNFDSTDTAPGITSIQLQKRAKCKIYLTAGDANGKKLKYKWILIKGPKKQGKRWTGRIVDFTTKVEGTYKWILIVIDEDGKIAVHYIKITCPAKEDE